MELDPATLAPADTYKLLIGGIVPRPIAWVSSVCPAGRPNLAPFSFFTGVTGSPMTLMFCPANKPDGAEKDTLRNCRPPAEGGTGEFVVNVVPVALARQMAACAEPLDHGQSEWELAGLEPAPAAVVRPARVRGSPMGFECRTERVIALSPGRAGGGNIVVGRVVRVWAAEGVLNDRLHADPAALDALGRMGGMGYCTTRDRRELPMGRAALTGSPVT